MEKPNEPPAGFWLDHFKRWAKLKEQLFLTQKPQPNDSMSTSYQENSSLFSASTGEQRPLEETELLYAEFRQKSRETEESFLQISNQSKKKIKNVFGKSGPADTYIDLTQEINALSSVLEQASVLKKGLHGTKRGDLLENIMKQMTSRINQMINLSSSTTEKLRQNFVRSKTDSPDPSEKGKITGQLRLLLEQSQDSEQEMERAELMKLTRAISDVKAILVRLSDMAVEQGSTIDRIDSNLVHTVEYVEKGNKALVRAIEHQESGCAAAVLKVQIMAVVVFFILLLFKYAK